jgi:Arc/MetJ-type ribon-helix-helix transcriptional regulator
MPRVNVDFPDGLARDLDDLVEEDEQFKSRSEAVRYAVRQLCQQQVIADE